jgi:rubrerythrin
MRNEATIETVLTQAIRKEVEAQELYRDLGKMAADDTSRDIFLQLVAVEKRHEELLRRYERGELGEGALEKGHVVDYKIAEHLELPPVKPDMKIDEVLLLAANREKASHEFYLGLAAIHPAGQVKTLLEELASQELEHKHRVEFLYAEVAYPQTSGG